MSPVDRFCAVSGGGGLFRSDRDHGKAVALVQGDQTIQIIMQSESKTEDRFFLLQPSLCAKLEMYVLFEVENYNQ